jgi:hypothetical protein
LFGNSTAGLRHDFCGNLEEFHRRTRGLFADVDTIERRHTISQFFLPFISLATENKLRLAIRRETGASARKLLGLSRSGMPQAVLKACLECLHEDEISQPTSWWRSRQQWPSAFVCKKHHRFLASFSPETRRSALASWHLPTTSLFRQSAQLPESTFDLLARIDHWADAVTDETRRFDPSILRYTYVLQARERGWLSADSSMRLRKLRDTFGEQFAPLVSEPTFHFINGIHEDGSGFLGALLRQSPSGHHPLKHMLLMSFLFDAPADFLVTYDKTSHLLAAEGKQALAEELALTYRQLRQLVSDREGSVSSAAKLLGISVSQAVKHLNASGTNYQRRSRVVGTNKEVELVGRLSRGENRQLIASTLGIRTSFIKDYLATRLELKRSWQTANFMFERDKHRKQLLSTLAAHPGLPIKKIRLIPGNGFQWLLNNDREWLQQQLPAIWRRPNAP